MNWFWSILLSLLAFLATFFYIRIVGKLFRGLFPKDSTTNWDNLKITLVRSAPTLATAFLLLLLRNIYGWIWISVNALWLSLAWDALHLVFTAYYIYKLRSVLRDPGTFYYQIKINPYEDWPESNILKIMPFRFLGRGVSVPAVLRPIMMFLTIFSRWKSELGILYGDFRRFLRHDFRYADVFDDLDQKLGYTEEELWAVPHLAVRNFDIYKREISSIFSGGFGDAIREKVVEKVQSSGESEYSAEEIWRAMEPSENESKFTRLAYAATGKTFLTNRFINSALPDELWEASGRLCQKMPPFIADTWKLYHFQEDVRLRLVLLFNAADLIQRLLGAVIFSALGEKGELSSLLDDPGFPRRQTGAPIFPPNTSGEWNRVLRWTLEHSASESIGLFRRLLLTPNPDFAADLARLAPFWDVLGVSSQIPADERNALAYFSTLAYLRNKTVGHGAVGWKFQLRAGLYLSALHHYFLAAVREISKFDFGVMTYYLDGEEIEIDSYLMGLSFSPPGKTRSECDVLILNPSNDEALDLYPFLRYHRGRLLIADRFFKDYAAYVDYNPENIAEPSFIDLPVD